MNGRVSNSFGLSSTLADQLRSVGGRRLVCEMDIGRPSCASAIQRLVESTTIHPRSVLIPETACDFLLGVNDTWPVLAYLVDGYVLRGEEP